MFFDQSTLKSKSRQPAGSLRLAHLGQFFLILVVMVSLVGANITPAQAAASWTAYNDCGYMSGQPNTYITTVQCYTNNATGQLKKFADGSNTSVTVTVTVSGASSQVTSSYGGAEPNAGTDAYETFHNFVNVVGGVRLDNSNSYVRLTFTGLDPAKTYAFATTANRANSEYSTRATKFSLKDATTAVNASTSGVTRSTTTFNEDTSVFVTGYNTVNGYVARWTGIQPGTDGDFMVEFTRNSSGTEAYGPAAFLLSEEGPAGPAISTAGLPLNAFATQPGVPSAAQTYTVSGSNLTAAVTVSAPAGFELSTNGTTYSSSLVLTPSGGTLAATTVYVRLTGASQGDYSGNITHTSPEISPVNVAVSGSVSQCSTANLVAYEDTYISGYNQGFNYGGVNLMKVTSGSSASNRRVILMKWDLSSIPTNATVSSASLKWYVSTAASETYSLYAMRRAWVEGTLTTGADSTSSANWTKYDGQNNWGTAGAANTSMDRFDTNLWNATSSSFSSTGSKTVALNAAGLDALEGWIAAPASNYGVTIQNNTNTSQSKDLNVSSSENTTAANRPTLILTYCLQDTTTYTLNAGNDGHGTVALNPPGGTYDSGTTVTLTPQPATGYQFSSWSGANAGELTSSGGAYTIVMNGNKTVTANFSLIPVNHAPNAPVLVQPADDATGLAIPPSLEVTASDADPADLLDVSFYGRLASPAATYELIGAVENLAVGAHASAVWIGLASDTEYEWYAVVNDGSATTNGPTWSFRTGEHPNNLPVALGQSVAVTKDIPRAITLTGTDPESSPLTFSITANPTHGALSGTLPNLTYTPDSGYLGPDSFTFKVSDGELESDPAVVSIVVEDNSVPLLPSSFMGEIHFVTGDNPPAAGGLVEAFKPGDTGAVASDVIETNAGNLTYALNVPGGAKGAASEGDPVTFKIGTRVAAVGAWHTGTNVLLNLHPPQALPGGPYSGGEGIAISFTGSANDWGSDAATYQWDWDNNGTFDATGQTASHAWTATGTYTAALKVTDAQGGEGTATFEVVISNAAPVLAAIGNQTVNEQVELAFTAAAVDQDPLTYTLVGAPEGAVIDPASGAFRWTPTEAQGPGDYPFTVKVCDNRTPALCDEEAISVHVAEANIAPVLAAIGNRNVVELTELSFTASATDADLPANTLTYALVEAPTGATIDPASGVFRWTPTAAQGPGTFPFTVKVCDGGSPALCDEESITVTVAASTETHHLDLAAGWNLISLDLAPVNPSPAAVLASVEGNYDLVYAWDSSGAHAASGNWQMFAPTPGGFQNTLTRLDEKMGFWIHMLQADTLDFTGIPPIRTEIQLSNLASGWNLVGYPAAGNGALPAILQDHGVGTDFTLVYAYHASDTADPWKLFDRGSAIGNDLLELSPGWGYWVYVSADHTWPVDYPTP